MVKYKGNFYEGKFEYEEEIIYWFITDTDDSIKFIKGREMWSRYIHFISDKGNADFTCIYGTVEDMSNLTDYIALEKYKELKEQRKTKKY